MFKTKAILGALTLDMFSVLFGGAIALLAVFAEDILKVGPQGFGILVAAPSIGSFLTMLVTAYIPISKDAGKKLLAAIFGFRYLYYCLWNFFCLLDICSCLIF